MTIVELLGVAIAIGIIFWCVYCIFGPQYVRCECGNKVKVGIIGHPSWYYWKCDKCGRSGKAYPCGGM